MTSYSNQPDNEGSNVSSLQKWVDPAMFEAEKMPEGGPKVHLLWMTPDPLGAAAAMNAMYVGKVCRNLFNVTQAERKALVDDMRKTVLKAPMEAIKLHFLIEGVTRGFTHQMVRQRTAVFAQESMRFAVVGEKQDIPVEVPPSIAQGQPKRKMLKDVLNDYPGIDSTTARGIVERTASPIDRARWAWDSANAAIQDAYQALVNTGIPAEDARGLLPTNVKTRLHYVTDLRNLQGVAGVRLSTQAQFEWKAVIAGMARAIREYNPHSQMIQSLENSGDWPIADEVQRFVDSDRWQYEAISDLFRPICYTTGKCEFMSTADRKCTIRERVQANHAIGRPSSEWDTEVNLGLPRFDQPQMPAFNAKGEQILPAIHPEEWLSDPTAAR